MRTPSIVVIGGGVAGVSSALGAVELGADNVVLLEKDHLGAASSALSAGVFNINPTDALTTEVRVRARARLDVYERENGLHLARIGYIRLARLKEQLELFEGTIELQKKLGVERPSRVLTPDQILEVYPDVRVDDVFGGLYNPEDGHLDGVLLCTAMAERARALGAVFKQKTTVLGIDPGSTTRFLVRTNNGDYPADVIINAAGAWADRVGEWLGAPTPLTPQVHEVVQIRLPHKLSYSVPMTQEYIPGYEPAAYFRQDGEQTLIAGMHTYDVLDDHAVADPDNYTRKVSDDYVEAVAERVVERLLIDDLGFAPGWTGIYPLSRDGEFIVGPYNDAPGVIACAGLGGHGVNGGVGVGPLAAEYAIFGEARSISGAAAMLPDRQSLRAPAGDAHV
ncbi:NAD(P)/FAD-dependent oxidoreductase [Rhodococcus koreensis]